MQKKIIALAIAGLSSAAFAQSNVTISGTLGASIDSYSLTGATTQRVGPTYRENRVSDQSSAIILSGSEDIGGGNKVTFQLDSRLTVDRGLGVAAAYANTPWVTSGLGNGNTHIAVGGSWGKLHIGRQDLHYDALANVENLAIAPALLSRFGHWGVMGSVMGTQIAVGSRVANAVWYVSPNIQGFQGTVAFSQAANSGEGEAWVSGNNGDPGSGNAVNLKLTYDNGPLHIVGSHWNYRIEGRDAYTNAYTWGTTSAAVTNTPTATAAPNPRDEISNRAGISYKFANGFKLGLGWDRSNRKSNAVTGDQARTAWMIPVSYTTGPHILAFNYAKAGRTSGQAASGLFDNTSASQYMLGYAYVVSKRTTVGLQYGSLTNKSDATYTMGGSATMAAMGMTSNIAGEDSKLTTLNVRHTF